MKLNKGIGIIIITVLSTVLSYAQEGLYLGFSSSKPTNTGDTGGPPSNGMANSPIIAISGLEGEVTEPRFLGHIPIIAYSVDVNSNLYLGSGGLTSGAGKPNGGEFKVTVNAAGKEYLGIHEYVVNSAIIPYARMSYKDNTSRIQEEFFLKDIIIKSIKTGSIDISTGQVGYEISMVYKAIKHVNYSYESNTVPNISHVTEVMFDFSTNTSNF